MQDYYFKYVCANDKTIFYAVRKEDLETIRNNDIKMYLEQHKDDSKIEKKSVEEKYPIIKCYPAKMTKTQIQNDLDTLGVPDNGTVVDADAQTIINIMNNSAGHPNLGVFGDLM